MDIITNSTQTGAPLHRDSLVCRRSDWMDVFTFLAIDFGLRAVTVLTPPGSTGLKSAQTCLWALICPASGVRSALLAVGVRETGEGDSELEEWIKKAFTWGRLTKGIKDGRPGELEMAKRSGALCMLVPSSARIRLLQQAESNTELKELPLRLINPLMTSVHGQYPSDIKPLRSPKNEPIAEERGEGFEYSLVKVPSSFTVDPILKENKPEPLMKMIWQWVRKGPEKSVAQSPKTAVPLRLSSNERIVKAVCTIFQILYGSYELYRMGGDHLKKYGYAAYEFTIIPYLSMSLMNLLVSCVRPTYPSMYIVYYRGDKRPEPPTTEEEKKESQEDQGKPVMSQSEVVPVDENWWGPGDGKLEENVSGAIGYVYGDLTMKEGGSEDRRHHHFFSISTWKSRFLENVSSPYHSLFITE